MSSAAELMVLFKGDASGLNAETEKSKGILGSLGGMLGGVGTMAAAGLAAGGAAAVGFGVMAVAAASDVAESQNKVNVVFGDSAGMINDLAATAASKLGQTKAEVLGAAGGIGNLLTAMGQSKEKAAEMSVGMVSLAADLGSFNNASSAEVLEAMQAAMAGETDGMKKYGVAINEATLKAAAMKAGLGENVQALSAAEKQMLTMNIMMEQTGSAQGDFANTSTGMANSMKIIKSTISDTVATIGAALLPTVEKVIAAVGPMVTQFGEAIPGAIAKVQAFLGPLAAEFSAVFSDEGGGVGGAIGVIDLLMEKLGLMGAGETGAAIMSAFETIKEAIAGIDWKGIGETVMNLVGNFKDGLAVVLPIVAGIFQNVLMPIISTVFGFFKEHTGILAAVGVLLLALTGPIGLVVAAFTILGALGPQVGEWVTAIGTGLVEGIGGIIADVVAEVTNLVSAIVDTFKGLLGIASPSQVFLDFGVNLLQGLIDGVASMIATVIATFTALGDAIFVAWEAIKVGVLATVEMIRVLISAKWDAIKEYLSSVLSTIGKVVSDAWDAIRSKVDAALAAMRVIIDTVWTWAGDFIKNALDGIQTVFNSVMDWIEQKTGVSMQAVRSTFDDVIIAIKVLIDGFVAFFTGSWGEAFELVKKAVSWGWDAVKSLFSAGWEAIKAILKIDALLAPFRDGMAEFSRIGGQLIDGLKKGISAGWDTLKAWMSGLFGDLITLAKKILGIASPSKVMQDEVGIPIGQGVIAGLKASLNAESAGGIIAGWATKQGPGFIAKMITPVIGAAIGAAITAGLVQAGVAPEQVNSGKGWSAWNNVQGGSRVGIQPGSMGKDSDDGRVRADAFRSGKGGHIAASSSNYWKVFVQRFGIPTESSARKVSAQLGIPLPQWLLDIFNPPQGETVDRPDVLKDPAAAVEAGFALTNLAKAATDAGDALKGVPQRFALEVEKAVSVIVAATGVIAGPGPGGRGIGIPIPGPGGSVAFGGSGGSSGGITDVAINAQSVTLRGPVNIGMTATLAVGGGRSLTAELVAALVTDTANLDKLIEAEDRRRAQKP